MGRGERSRRPLNLVPDEKSVVKSPQGSVSESEANVRRTQKAHALLDKLISEAAQRGFYGELNLKVKMMDGTIQQIYESSEQMHSKI